MNWFRKLLSLNKKYYLVEIGSAAKSRWGVNDLLVLVLLLLIFLKKKIDRCSPVKVWSNLKLDQMLSMFRSALKYYTETE